MNYIGDTTLLDMGAVDMIMSNESTAWIGYALYILVAVVAALTVASGFLVKLINNMKSAVEAMRKKPTHDYKAQVKNDSRVTEHLRFLRHDLHADRVCIVRFHNGINDIANNSLLKISMSHEALSVNVPSIMNEIQGWPANYIGTIQDEIFDGRYVAHHDVEELKDDASLRGVYDQMRRMNVKSLYCFPIAKPNGRIFGIGVVHYMRRHYTMEPEWIRDTQTRFSAMGGLIAAVGSDEEHEA